MADVEESMSQAIEQVDHEINVVEHDGKEIEKLSEDTQAAIEMLSTGVLSAFLPEMDNMKERVHELTKNQGVLIETMQQENAKFGESQEAKALIEIVSQVKNYHSKLNRIHIEMEQINERVARLKRRANKLKVQKEKEEKNKLDAKKREQEIERQLIAKPATDKLVSTVLSSVGLYPCSKEGDEVLYFKKLTELAIAPSRGSSHAAGYDLYSAYDTVIPANGKALVKTDIAVAIPDGCYGRVAPRSSLALKHQIDVGAGVIDRDYRGNVGVVLFNLGQTDYEVHQGDRVAQLVVERISMPVLVEVQDLDNTARGAGGYGSTGK